MTRHRHAVQRAPFAGGHARGGGATVRRHTVARRYPSRPRLPVATGKAHRLSRTQVIRGGTEAKLTPRLRRRQAGGQRDRDANPPREPGSEQEKTTSHGAP